MWIQDALDSREARKEDKRVDEAIKIFEKQRQAIRNIQDTDGFKAILDFLEVSVEAGENSVDLKFSQQKFSTLMANKKLYRFLTSRLKD